MRLDPSSQRGDIIVGWLTRLVAVFAVIGIAGYDAISLTVTKATASDHAGTAALDAAEAWAQTRDLRQTYAAAAETAARGGDTVATNSLVVDADGTVHVRLCRTATTLLLQRTDRTRKWTKQCGSGQGRAVGS